MTQVESAAPLAAPPPDVVASAATGRQFVTFVVADEVFAFPLAEVQEIIRLPELIQVPMSPPSIRGLANLRGNVLPVLSLRRALATGDRDDDEATRVVVVVNGGRTAGFVVDRMSNVIIAEPDQIEAGGLGETVDADLLTGIVKNAGGHAMVQVLAPDQIVEREIGAQLRVEAGSRDGDSRGPGEPATGATLKARAVDEIQLVSFTAAGQEYALPIESVKEIVQVPDKITQVPNAGAHVVGVMTLRDRLLHLVNLRHLLQLEPAPLRENDRIVVTSVPGGDSEATVGIVMDSVKEVLRVNRALVEPVPPLLVQGDGGGIEAICRLDDGKRLVCILSAAALLGESRAAGVSKGESEAEMEQGSRVPDDRLDDEEQCVLFRVGGEEYGVPIDSVQEIVRVPEQLTKIPKTPSFIEGVVNLRGAVLPVIDQRRRFGISGGERNDRQRIVVFLVGGVRTGFIVDSVTEVAKLPRRTIGPAPLLSGEQARLINRVANLETQKRMVLLLDVTQLLATAEIEEISRTVH